MFMRVILLGLCVFGWVAIVTLVRTTPAYNADLRLETVYGSVGIPRSVAMYDRGSYLFEVGYTYVTADALFSADTEAVGELASPEESLARAEYAVELISEATTLDPSNAHAWATLAWARALSGGTPEEVLHDLRRSWALAPNNRALANQRLNLIGSLLEFSPEFGELFSEEDMAATLQDSTTLKRYDRGLFVSLINDTPVIEPFVVLDGSES